MYLGAPEGPRILNGKYRRQAIAIASIKLDSAAVRLGHDPYRDLVWVGDALVDLLGEVQQVLTTIETTVWEVMKARLGSGDLGDWAAPLIAAEVEKVPAHKTHHQLLQMIEGAIAEGGSIVYWGD